MTRYKSPQFQALYANMLVLAADETSEMYWEGEPRRGAGHRAAFWDGFSGKFDFSGPKRSAHVIPGTPSAVCFMAGREFARIKKSTPKETSMLTIAKIQELADKYGLELKSRFPHVVVVGTAPPKPTELIVYFKNEIVEAWVTLMTNLTEVPIDVYGTRQMTGSGATDDRLYPGYAAKLQEVNTLRERLGLGAIYN